MQVDKDTMTKLARVGQLKDVLPADGHEPLSEKNRQLAETVMPSIERLVWSGG
jgi:hypothetical protein